ncbi:MAG: hypothetical protein LQ340_000240 [Diploschistes diacapsis]|nr:MAG: hypothetical protein LQ340_000240 [Diploschistes diacapsis]
MREIIFNDTTGIPDKTEIHQRIHNLTGEPVAVTKMASDPRTNARRRYDRGTTALGFRSKSTDCLTSVESMCIVKPSYVCTFEEQNFRELPYKHRLGLFRQILVAVDVLGSHSYVHGQVCLQNMVILSLKPP